MRDTTTTTFFADRPQHNPPPFDGRWSMPTTGNAIEGIQIRHNSIIINNNIIVMVRVIVRVNYRNEMNEHGSKV